MSYSFTITAANKEAAKAAVAAELEKVVVSQPDHIADQAAALANANAMIDLLNTDDTRDITVSCHGGLSLREVEGQPTMLTQASTGCNAYYTTRV